MLAEIRCGAVLQGDGTVTTGRASRIGALVTGDGQGRYYENTARGNVFSFYLNATATGISAGNIVGAAAAAATQFAVWNPPGSGKNLSLLKFGVWPISGTAPIPPVSHSISITAPTIASSFIASYPLCCNNAGMAASSVSRYLAIAAQAGTALTGSSILQVLRAADLYITAGTAANLTGMKCIEFIDGDIVIPPGTGWVPTWVSGAALLQGYSLTWEEIPV
jgi:hypothetical protein